MGEWSEQLKEKTRQEISPGVMVKDLERNSGFYFTRNGKIEIKGVKGGIGMPLPNDETVATFDSIEEMIEAGWVID